MIDLTIITVCYNNRDGLEKTICSVVDQTFKNYQFIIVDGGSTDGSVDVINNYNQFIAFWVSEKDNGIYNAMNKGISKAEGRYCLFLNSGDCLADKFVLQKVFECEPSADIVYGDVICIKSKWDKRLLKYPEKLTLFDFYKQSAAIHHQASFIRKELFDRYGTYDEDLKVIGDWEFFFRTIIVQRCSTMHLDKVVAIVEGAGRSHKVYSADDPFIAGDLEMRNTLIQKYFPDYILDDYKELAVFKIKRLDRIKMAFRRVFAHNSIGYRFLHSVYVRLSSLKSTD
jgi:glycosyltransferase involved in cell wall biosynthesis